MTPAHAAYQALKSSPELLADARAHRGDSLLGELLTQHGHGPRWQTEEAVTLALLDIEDEEREAKPRTKATVVYPDISRRTTDPQVTFEATAEPLRQLGVAGEVWNNRLIVIGVFDTLAEAEVATDRYVRNIP